MGAGWASFALVREMFLACSRTLDFASTMEDVPAVVDLKRTRGIFLDAAERCIIFWVGEKKDGEWSSYREREKERKRETRCAPQTRVRKSGVEADTDLVSSSHVRDSASLRFTGDRLGRGPGFILLLKVTGESTSGTYIIGGLHSRKAGHGPLGGQTDSFSRPDRSGELFLPCLSRG